jgi:hypothetical protein
MPENDSLILFTILVINKYSRERFFVLKEASEGFTFLYYWYNFLFARIFQIIADFTWYPPFHYAVT